jgi:hypothetical protein
MKSLGIPKRHGHLVFGLIQSGITCAVAAAVASWPLMQEGTFTIHWVRAWAISWVTMLPVVIVATPIIRVIVDRLLDCAEVDATAPQGNEEPHIAVPIESFAQDPGGSDTR